MNDGFRQSMAWLHTWTGLLVGWLLFMVFAAGTATYFRHEITFWMKPELHLTGQRLVPQPLAVTRAVALLQQRAGTSPRWFITLPSERQSALLVGWNTPPKPGGSGRRGYQSVTMDPASGAELSAPRATRGGEFFYRLHFDLHYMPPLVARWIVGFCAMFMLVAILSGIVTHRRIFQDFFTFRPKKGQRSWLDAHNATAVLALPYHLMITYTGLVTMMFMYLPQGVQATYNGDVNAFYTELQHDGTVDTPAAGRAAPLTALAPLVRQASMAWNGAPVGRMIINHPNDGNATVLLERRDGGDMAVDQPSLLFDGVGGRLLSAPAGAPSGALHIRGVLYGLHIAHFAAPLLRALFFLCGLAGCAMVATGLLLWAVKVRQKQAKRIAAGGRAGCGLRLVDGLNLGAIAGLPLAMAVFFWANRLLPVGLAARPEMEIRCFFWAWGGAAVAGLAWPGRRMWVGQLALAGALLAGIPALNAATTATGLATSIRLGLWPVAGFDLVTLALGLALLWAAWWLVRRSGGRVAPRPAHVAAMAAERDTDAVLLP